MLELVIHHWYHESPSFDQFYTIHVLKICVALVLVLFYTRLDLSNFLFTEISAAVLCRAAPVI
jgi:hypothetical protein